MSIKKQYQKDVQEVGKTNLAFDDIKANIVTMKENNKKHTGFIISASIGGTLVLAGSIAFAVIMANRSSSKNGPTNNSGNIVVPNDKKLSIGALAKSVTPLMSATFAQEINKPSPLMMKSAIDTSKSDEEIIQDLLYQFDTIIENNNNYTVTPMESDKADYTYREDITFKDLLDHDNTYSLYFNDITTKEEQDEDEMEKKSTYSGIAVQGENTYTFKLNLKEETSQGESEVKSTFYLYTSEDLRSYTKVTSESEIEGLESETQYGYEIYENGTLVTSYEIEIETDSQKQETEISIELNNKEYSITKVIKNNETYFYVELEDETTDTEVEYVYKKVVDGDNVSYELQSSSTDNDDDEDDD